MRGAPCNDIADEIAKGRAVGTQRLIVPLLSVTLRYRDVRPDLENDEKRKKLILDYPAYLFFPL